jgi:hypothetical protein
MACAWWPCRPAVVRTDGSWSRVAVGGWPDRSEIGRLRLATLQRFVCVIMAATDTCGHGMRNFKEGRAPRLSREPRRPMERGGWPCGETAWPARPRTPQSRWDLTPTHPAASGTAGPDTEMGTRPPTRSGAFSNVAAGVVGPRRSKRARGRFAARAMRPCSTLSSFAIEGSSVKACSRLLEHAGGLVRAGILAAVTAMPEDSATRDNWTPLSPSCVLLTRTSVLADARLGARLPGDAER